MKSEADFEGGAWGTRNLPTFCNHLLAGEVSVSLASSKSWVSPLKAFVKFKNVIRFHHQAFTRCKNGQPWWPTEIIPLFQNTRIHPRMPISSLGNFFASLFYWTPSAWRLLQKKEGLSVRPSIFPFILPSVRKFSRDWVISFFWKRGVLGVHIWHGVRGPYIVACDSRIFWKKIPIWENGQKWAKNMVFGLFKKTMSLVLSEICVKWKFLWFINILRKLHAWEKSGSQVIAKNGSWSMRFQYSLIVNISLID